MNKELVKSDNLESISKEVDKARIINNKFYNKKLPISFIPPKDWLQNSIRRETRIRPYAKEREREKVLLRTKIIDWMRSATPIGDHARTFILEKFINVRVVFYSKYLLMNLIKKNFKNYLKNILNIIDFFTVKLIKKI